MVRSIPSALGSSPNGHEYLTDRSTAIHVGRFRTHRTAACYINKRICHLGVCHRFLNGVYFFICNRFVGIIVRLTGVIPVYVCRLGVSHRFINGAYFFICLTGVVSVYIYRLGVSHRFLNGVYFFILCLTGVVSVHLTGVVSVCLTGVCYQNGEGLLRPAGRPRVST